MRANEKLSSLRGKLLDGPEESSHAAVAILLRERNDDLEFFLVKRAEVEGDPWSGDMAFPGGKRGDDDRDLVETASREVLEETAIDLREKSKLGYMKPIFSSVRTNMKVQPIVYVYDEEPEVSLNYELTRYLWAPLSELVQSRTKQDVKGWNSDVYKYDGEVVWGLTFRMLEQLIKIIEA
ncbi:CoA pyrophosphatase [Candidatus Bathyarchaeota archaeon]|nr:CoA pyrophosphatase [Candidatus Bathyarchaeota archaeon]MBT4321203.1 CoA pyrophosphatase [Candidatus Bathyarchaeota archaeon]MBT4423644.1 CoA pyrophosphatase [Candidatus Bathyarchaeota archaeon]MBT6605795.1 CoA pyrophosphatase [Candidatus Bathyarchaeota archaeon]MBT7185987.1 CoA pyrophosphatase [Candidatus Bathyarchaeota archaeon]